MSLLGVSAMNKDALLAEFRIMWDIKKADMPRAFKTVPGMREALKNVRQHEMKLPEKKAAPLSNRSKIELGQIASSEGVGLDGSETVEQIKQKIQAMRLSQDPTQQYVKNQLMPFGKHKDKSFEWIRAHDPTFVIWASATVADHENVCHAAIVEFVMKANKAQIQEVRWLEKRKKEMFYIGDGTDQEKIEELMLENEDLYTELAMMKRKVANQSDALLKLGYPQAAAGLSLDPKANKKAKVSSSNSAPKKKFTVTPVGSPPGASSGSDSAPAFSGECGRSAPSLAPQPKRASFRITMERIPESEVEKHMQDIYAGKYGPVEPATCRRGRQAEDHP